MNERIKELKRQASIWCDQNIPGEFDENIGGYGYHWEEKFAELIVQECIKEMEEFTIMSEDYVQWNQALSHVALYLKDHFGIDQ